VFGLLEGPTQIDDDALPAVSWADAPVAIPATRRQATADVIDEPEFGELDVDVMPPPAVPFMAFDHPFVYALLAPIAPAQPSPHVEHERAFTTVCDPPVFPGGDLGTVAVIAAIDELLAVDRVRAKTLDLHITVEAGTSLQLIRRTLRSALTTARAAGVEIVAARGAVAPVGGVDGIALAITARGESPGPRATLRADLPIVVTKPVGAYGAALLDVDHAGVTIAAELGIDVVAAATRTVAAATMHRDGGLRAACKRLATDDFELEIDDWRVPVRDEVRRFARDRGLDPLTLRSSGIVMVVEPSEVTGPLTVIGRVRARGG
jgi:hydrogenase expression/formation protein HypE